ncbi:MAG: hypothetical protein NZL91_03135 [Thermoflexales bacterium]|nr:hypothetical protein [Thermoflexales bacterium]MCS7325561.1 hypothetical protein [Thermoflexales bacterium]MCX7938791.1 hypothetical protein [Thermoflexales bacterium]MDW8054639.1 hypothetical protein [Anaerolineae bacterium]MDW8292973.1 hypothetical protein [Anaerolineae bacterium]
MSERLAWAALALSVLLFLALAMTWLWLSTRTAHLMDTLEQLDRRREMLRESINALWIEIGEQTAPNVVEMRARQLGFVPARALEYADAEKSSAQR